MIELRNIQKSFGTQAVLKGINLSIKRGEVIGIVGENGAGKSTLFNCLAGMLDFEGEIASEIANYKKHLGYLETNPYLLPKITGSEYLRLLCMARGLAFNASKPTPFDLPLDKYAESYSTGMKKKLALQAVLLQKNEVFILDEPFNGVDLASSMIISEIILRLKAKGKPIIISSHIFSTLKEVCTVIYVLQDGLLSSPIFPEQFAELESQMKQFTIGNKLDHVEF